MKKLLLIVLAFCICHTVLSQETETEEVKTKATNEIKLNLLMSVLSFPDISYERVWSNNFGLGLTLGIPLGSGNSTNFQILPYGRFYFGESLIKSFFIEGNMAFIGYEDYYYYDYSSSYSNNRNSIGFGLGVAFGYKYINSKGLIGELFLGMGRTFNYRDQIYPRVGISIGMQF